MEETIKGTIKGCIFDLDGTLLNTLKALTYTTNRTLGHFGLGPVDEAYILGKAVLALWPADRIGFF